GVSHPGGFWTCDLPRADPSHYLPNGICGALVIRAERMGVSPQRDRGARMAEPVGDGLEVNAFGKQSRSNQVSQVVKANSVDPEPFTCPGETSSDGHRVVWLGVTR